MLLYSTDSAVRPGYAGVPPAGTPWGRRHPARRHTLGARASRPQRPGVRGRPRPQARPGCAGIPPAGTPWGRRRPRPQAHPGGAGILPTGTPWVRGRPARNALGGAGVLARRHALGAQASSPAGMPWECGHPARRHALGARASRPQARPGCAGVLARRHALGVRASRSQAHPGHAGIPPAGTPWARRRPACLGTLGARASSPAGALWVRGRLTRMRVPDGQPGYTSLYYKATRRWHRLPDYRSASYPGGVPVTGEEVIGAQEDRGCSASYPGMCSGDSAGLRSGARGREITTVVPTPTVLSTAIRPPIASTNPFAIERPSPALLFSRPRAGSAR